MVSGAADNTLRLWDVSTGKCLYTWEFPTAVKRVAFKADDSQVVCITEQRMGHQCTIRVFYLNGEGDGTKRACFSTSRRLFLPIEVLRCRIEGPTTHVQPYWLKSDSVCVHVDAERHHHRARIGENRAIQCEEWGRGGQ